MPELPEVETIVRDLRPLVMGQTITAIEVRWPRLIAAPTAEVFEERIVGQWIERVGRRGKYIVASLSQDTLLVHLGMTGRLLVSDSQFFPLDQRPLEDRHTHVLLQLSSGRLLAYRDVRKFGRLFLVREANHVVGKLGPEPLGTTFTAERLGQMLRGRHKRLKDLLLDQTFVAGLGNIYTDEALWEARLSPHRLADTLSRPEAVRLHAAIRGILERGIAARGTTLSDYRDGLGRKGTNQHHLRAYGRTGRPCPRCGAPIVREVVGGRGTHFCQICQRV